LITVNAKRSDYYTLLGIDRSASAEEIGRAYRRAARATHPDAHPDEPSATERFAAITIAYETLRDPTRRASYDRARPVTSRGVRVQPVGQRPPNPPLRPIHLGRPSRPRVEPLSTPESLNGALPGSVVNDDFFELAALVTWLLRPNWHSP
jgi:curved DNA-binding protein CbpA